MTFCCYFRGFDSRFDGEVREIIILVQFGAVRQEMQEERPKLKMLMKLLSSTPFYLEKRDNKYYVIEE